MEFLSIRNLYTLMTVNKRLWRISTDHKLWSEHPEFPYRMDVEKGRKSLLTKVAEIFKSEPGTPEGRLCHSAVMYNGQMLINGGHNTVTETQLFHEVKSDLWVLDLASKKWQEVTEPRFPKRTEHSAVVWADKLWLFGGFAGDQFVNDVICYDIASKALVPVHPHGNIPSARSAHVAVAAHGKMWVFGGWNGTDQNNDMLTFDFATHEWSVVQPRGPQPLARCSHCVALAPSQNSFFIFGGYGGLAHSYLADLWQFSFDSLTWANVGRLQPRSRMRMAEYGSKLYLYGGWNSELHFSDMHEFDIVSRSWRQIHQPGLTADEGKMGQYSMCVHDKRLIMFGGYDHQLRGSTNKIHCFRLGRPDFVSDAMQCD